MFCWPFWPFWLRLKRLLIVDLLVHVGISRPFCPVYLERNTVTVYPVRLFLSYSFGFILIDFLKLGNPYDAAAAYGYEGYGAEYAGYGPGEEGYYGYGGGYGGGNAPITIEIEAK